MCGKCDAASKKKRGCTEPVPQPHPFHGDPPFATCPLTFFRDNPGLELEALTLHKHWTNGILPEAGGLLDQPAAYEVLILATDLGISQGLEAKRDIEQRKADHKMRGKGGGGKSPARRSRR